MGHTTWAGRRGRALRDITTPTGFIAQDSCGTLQKVLALPGRFLVLVQWDNGLTIPVPASEIAIFTAHEDSHGDGSQARHRSLAISAPSALACYLVLTLGLFVLGWTILGANTTLYLLATVYFASTGTILLFYWIEELFAQHEGLQEPRESSMVDKQES